MMEDLMNKKKIGAMLSVIAAVSAGASAYATTIGNLDQDQHTNSLISDVDYTDSYSDYDLVKNEYTSEVKNTKVSQEASSNNQKQGLIEKAANDALVEIKAQRLAKKSVLKDAKEDKSEDVKTTDSDEKSSEEVKDTKEVAEKESQPVADVTSVKYVNAELVNLRSSKDLDDNNILATLKAGDKVIGKLEDGFLGTEAGYIKEEFLTDSYPEDLVRSIKEKEEARIAQEAKEAEEAKIAEEARKAEEAKKAEEARKAEEAKKAEEVRKAEEAKKAEEARKAEEAKKAEEARKAEEAKKAQEAKAAQESRAAKAQSYYKTGWVSTSILNVRSSANGNIIGSVKKGEWLEGQASNGWLAINYNGQTGYVSLDYISDTEVAKEVAKPAPAPAPKEEVAEEASVEKQAPQVSGSGQSAANIASQFVGLPYIWGAADPNVGFDCSGLTSYVYSQLGVYIPHQSAAQYSYGYSVDFNNLQAGDLVFFSTGGRIDHVGIMVSSDGTFIHASTPATGVKYDNIYNSYYQSSFAGAKRIY